MSRPWQLPIADRSIVGEYPTDRRDIYACVYRTFAMCVRVCVCEPHSHTQAKSSTVHRYLDFWFGLSHVLVSLSEASLTNQVMKRTHTYRSIFFCIFSFFLPNTHQTNQKTPTATTTVYPSICSNRSASSEQDNSDLSEHSEKSPLVSARLDNLARLFFSKSMPAETGSRDTIDSVLTTRLHLLLYSKLY